MMLAQQAARGSGATGGYDCRQSGRRKGRGFGAAGELDAGLVIGRREQARRGQGAPVRAEDLGSGVGEGRGAGCRAGSRCRGTGAQEQGRSGRGLAVGKVYPFQEVVRKVLRSLPKNWEAKKTAIEESKNLNTLKLEDLIGKLITYEIKVQVDGGVEVVEKKKKNVAFKASNQKEENEDDASNDEHSNEEDITKLISKEVKRFMKKNIKSKLAKKDEGESTKRSVKCYECNKMGHYRNECPKLKKGERKNKKSMKKKAFTATWSNDETNSTESESSLENGVANLCFMAQEDSYSDEEE
ncbi:hypothetical protein SLEP1_g22635 [Rubroshorea leprosula]|uniref:CCHC-type domain-containing protein n=1 Tax=Rubroshorea leprosula TaxID=152421 RepID=A0AAV5JFX6_9ROSI|nr:hypothetical protein SLEP1_g22635 [Rubroshorea leprosula]